LDSDEYDSVVLMKKEKEYLWEKGQPKYDKYHIPNSNTLPDTIIESMGLYIVKKECALRTKMRYGDNTYMLTADAVETVDVNYPDEFALAESIMRGMKEKENLRLRVMTKFFNSAIFSDILGDMGIDATISGLVLNQPDRKIFARANTLKIRALNEGEDYHGIYEGLKTYERITPGEVIVVENQVEDRAYFGELNANLAIRAGAVGTIVSSVTRDIEAVNMLDYPVFSKGYCCADVKRKATIESHQQPICIQGININPGDLIFADNCGVVCIPHRLEKQVLRMAVEAKEKEKSIIKRVLDNENAIDIYKEEGEF
jgi:regulator of RNase E activity RraA